MSEEEAAASAPAAAPHPVKPRSLKSLVHKNPLLRIFTIISAVTILIAVLIGIAAVLSLVYIKTLSLPGIVLRLYAIFFCLTVVLSELELTKAVRESVLVTSWLWRGIAYIFIGTLVYEMRPETDYNKMQDAYIQGTSVSLVVLGILYFIMGALCVKRWRDGMVAKYKTMMAHAEMSDALRAEAGLLDSPGGRL